MNGRTALLAAGVSLALLLSLAVSILNTPTAPGLAVEFRKTGGIAGVADTLVISQDGTVVFTSSHSASFSAALRTSDFQELKTTISTNIGAVSNAKYPAKQGAADYFGYELVSHFEGKNLSVAWVDEWATERPIPEQLKQIQNALDKALQLTSAESQYRNQVVAHADLKCDGGGVCGALEVELFTDKTSYKFGEQVRIFLALRNSGTKDVNYTSPTPCDPDFRITVNGNASTQDVSFKLPVVACIQVLQSRTLHHGESLIQTAAWDDSFDQNGMRINAPPGAYTISARFPLASFEPSLLEASILITLNA